jgi:hypothetical protein
LLFYIYADYFAWVLIDGNYGETYGLYLTWHGVRVPAYVIRGGLLILTPLCIVSVLLNFVGLYKKR